jgi:DNA (cytosine-5)-methyltransferase 1
LTLREAARIQTFPDDHVFVGGKSTVYKQIGNAVPCGLAEAVARSVIDILDGRAAVPNEPCGQQSLALDTLPRECRTA